MSEPQTLAELAEPILERHTNAFGQYVAARHSGNFAALFGVETARKVQRLERRIEHILQMQGYFQEIKNRRRFTTAIFDTEGVA